MKKWQLYSIFFAILLICFWGLLYKYTNWFTQSKLAKRSTVQVFSFINQDSATVTNEDMLGKVCVVEYFFTTCAGICPKMNKNMKDIFETFKNKDNFLIVSHTCQPEYDSVFRLKAYSQKMGADNRKWIFVTGDKEKLYKMARFSYGIDDPKNAVDNIEDDFVHSQFFALIDKNGNVRGGVYDGIKKEEMERLKKDIQGLLDETSRKNNFTGVFGN